MSRLLAQLFILLAAVAPLSSRATAEDSGLLAANVVAIVNGTPISRKSLDDVVEATLSLGGHKLDEAQKQQLRRDALTSLVDLELLYAESQKVGIKVTDAELDGAIDRSRSRFSSNDQFDQALRAKGLDRDQLRRDTYKTMAVDRYLESKVWRGQQVTPEEVRAYYDSNPDQFTRPPEVRASHVLFRVPKDAGPDVRRRAQEKAARALKELRAGRDFGEVARLSSEDPGTARQGGDLGYFARGEMLPEVEEQAFTLERGQISNVFETELGYDILKVTDKRAGGLIPFAEVEPRIRGLLLKEKRDQSRQEVVDRLRATARIEILDPSLTQPAPTPAANPAS